MSAIRTHHRTSLALGWEAARANLASGLVIQMVMLGDTGFNLYSLGSGFSWDIIAKGLRRRCSRPGRSEFL
jgi:hypothetical protein